MLAAPRFLQHLVVALLSVLVIAFGSLQVVAFKRAGYSLGPYPYFILLSVGGSFVPLLAIAAAFQYLRPVRGFSAATLSRRSLLAYAVIGALNGTNGVLTIFSVPFVGGVSQSILAQLVIPLTLLLSWIVLNTRFGYVQLIGAAVIVGGVAIEVVPPLVSLLETRSGGGGGSSSSSTSTSSPWWMLVFAAGQVPQALNGVYQELAFGGGRDRSGRACCGRRVRRSGECCASNHSSSADATTVDAAVALLAADTTKAALSETDGATQADATRNADLAESVADESDGVQAAASGGSIDVTYMMMWASVFQMLLLAVAAPLNWIPELSRGGGWSHGSGSSAASYFRDALSCLARQEQATPARTTECNVAAIDLAACVLTMLMMTVLQVGAES